MRECVFCLETQELRVCEKCRKKWSDLGVEVND